MAVISLKDICKTFEGGVQAVRELSLTIGDGELVVLLGPSGCGKSTVLRMIAGLETPTSGTITIGDRVVNDVPPKDRDIAMVFQNYALYPHMTVYGNMAFGLKLRRLPKKEIDKRIRDTAALLELSQLLDRKPKALSGGQRQRVALGRAIVRNPVAFLFDEPLSNLDAKLRVQMRVEIARLHAQLGTTMVYVTHDQVEAMTLGNRLVLLKDGVAQQIDAPLELYERPSNQFVASFIGSPPMNFLSGQLISQSGAFRFESADGFGFSVAGAHARTLTDFANKPITAGIRPEDIGSEAARALPNAPQLRALVELVEPMGFEQHVYLRIGEQRCVCRVDSHQRYELGAEIAVPVLTENAHFFDAESGATLLHA